jgi:hypothetical protein
MLDMPVGFSFKYAAKPLSIELAVAPVIKMRVNYGRRHRLFGIINPKEKS